MKYKYFRLYSEHGDIIGFKRIPTKDGIIEYLLLGGLQWQKTPIEHDPAKTIHIVTPPVGFEKRGENKK